MNPVDLHVHSNQSDGSVSPAALVDLAIQKRLSAFALTDHDTTAGLKEAVAAGRKKGIEVIPGIEFSTGYSLPDAIGQPGKEKDIHIVGLFIEEDAPGFQDALRFFVEERSRRNKRLCERLQADGIAISCEALQDAFPHSVLTRGHYARFLLDHGYVKSLPEAFERYLGDHTGYFVPREKITPCQAVRLILSARGIPVLAHPVLYHMASDDLARLVGQLKEAGLVALETLYASYSAAESRQMRRLARRFDLLPSGGSDFHGRSKPGLEMGTGYGSLFVSADVLDTLKEKRKELFHV